MSEPQRDIATKPQSTSEPPSSAFSKRSLRQLGLFFGGAGFFAISSLITRKALVRRYKASIPRFYQQSNRPNLEVNGALEAVEALTIATVNVFSVGMMFSGGMLWAFDISSVDDLRRKIRGGLGSDGDGRESRADEEMEEWLATVLARKDEKKQRAKDKESREAGGR